MSLISIPVALQVSAGTGIFSTVNVARHGLVYTVRAADANSLWRVAIVDA